MRIPGYRAMPIDKPDSNTIEDVRRDAVATKTGNEPTDRPTSGHWDTSHRNLAAPVEDANHD